MSECCATCDWFALEPGKRRSGACLDKWQGDSYAATISWNCCANWTPKGAVKRCKPERWRDIWNWKPERKADDR